MVGSWWPKLAGSVRGLAVVVPGVLGQDVPKVALAEDRHPVGELGTGGEHEPLRVGVRARAAGRDLQGGDAGVGAHSVEGGGELAGPVRTRYLNVAARSARSSSRFLACWVVHTPSGLAVTPRTWT